MKILHVITSLKAEGAQNMLLKLVRHTCKGRHEHVVVSLLSMGPVGAKLSELGVSVHSLNLKTSPLLGLLSLRKIVKSEDADLVQTWMYHSDLLGGIAARLFCDAPVVWGVRGSDPATSRYRISTIVIAYVSGYFFSRWLPRAILLNSEVARSHHKAIGYDESKMVTIPNGFCMADYDPQKNSKNNLKNMLGVDKNFSVIGMVGRFDPVKAHDVFIKAAMKLATLVDNAVFVFCGDGVDMNNKKLAELIRDSGCAERFYCLGRRDDIASITAGFDIATLCSHAEGFPNVVGEAMACGVPVVCTDVGDCADIVGDVGSLVAVNDPAALCEGWLRMLRMDPLEFQTLGIRARNKIRDNYSIDVVAEKYVSLYESLRGE